MGWSSLCSLLVICGVLSSVVVVDGAFVGVVYGYSESGPTPQEAVQLLQENGVSQVRIYDTNPEVLSALSNSSLDVVVGVTNQELEIVGQSNTSAALWVTSKLIPYIPSVNITGIAVGSEVLTSESIQLANMLVPAMGYIHSALVMHGLDSQIKISTTNTIDVLDSYFPPSQGSFNQSYLQVILPMLNFLSITNSYIMFNLYPYYLYQASSSDIPLTYALFQPNQGIVDSSTNITYTALYDAQLDAVYAAMNKLNSSQLEIVVSETGWPSAGDSYEIGPSMDNAQAYNGNLAARVYKGTGTPAMPGSVSSAYIYELFNELSRQGPLSERSWGLFNNNTSPVYAIDLTGSGRETVGGTSGGGYYAWCVAKDGYSDKALQDALDYACGTEGVNCTAIQPNGACYLPDTTQSHASYAMNLYFQKEADKSVSCDFNGLAKVTTTNPSYDSCIYYSSPSYDPAYGPIGSQSDGFKLTARLASFFFSSLVFAFSVYLLK